MRSMVINKYVESKYRATVISTFQFFVQIPYVLIAMFFGLMIEYSFVQTFYLLVTAVIFIAILWSMSYKIKPKSV